MYAIAVLALFIAGANAGFLHQPAIYAAAAPVAIKTPVLTHTFPTYAVNSPIAHHVESSFAAPAPIAYAAPAYAAAPIAYAAAPLAYAAAPAPILKTHHFGSPHVYAGAYNHHFAAPAYGFALRK